MNPEPKTDPRRSNQPRNTKRHPWYLQVALLLILVALFFIVYDYVHIRNNRVLVANSRVALSLVPKSEKLAKNKTFTTEIWLDSLDQSVNAVQVSLSYPADKLQYQSIDGGGSAFEIQAEASGGKGKVVIARGHKGSVAGRQLIAKVNFKPTVSAGSATVDFAKGTAVVRTNDNTNVLGHTQGAHYDLEGK